MFFCAISGSPPTNPVVAKTSGTVYEKALIERYIEENGTDPVSGEALTLEDLVEVKAKPNTLPPRASTQTSIPSLLVSLQSEYDAIMLESFTIKKAYTASRQELANTLYREDAATRVIARLIKERDEAREALASIQSAGFTSAAPAEPTADVEMADESKLPQEVEDKIVATNQALSSVRKKRKPAAGYVTPDAIKSYTQTSTVPSMHMVKTPGINALDVSSDGNLTLTGGNDKNVQIYDFASEKVAATLKGHTKAVTHVAFASDNVALSASSDKTVRVWGDEGGKWASKHSITGAKAEIVGLQVHPTGSYAAAASADQTWSLYDLESFEAVKKFEAIPGDNGSFEFSSLSIHPDGILHGLGTKDGSVRVWDVRNASALAATLPSQSAHAVTTLSFSENGYYLATASSSAAAVNVFDLRKLAILKAWELPAENTINEVRFDTSAQFLSVTGTDFRVYQNKTWDELLKYDDNADVLTAARFGPLGSKVVLSGKERMLRVLGKAE